ncbi:MAG: NUDIX domain-containing protein [Gammaproteobacteria bacterium]|nr:NUDIX domain-containing protein [Gammaproteobacteria bacterium]NVK89097.1 NUDIX domain-containing protein [Gammaproteobacteria bacterium]
MSDPKKPMKYRVEQRRPLYQGFFSVDECIFAHDTFEKGEVSAVRREVFRRGDAVGVLLIDIAQQELLLVEQFRAGAAAVGAENPWLLELVAGIVEPGESLAQVVIRECEEEVGCRPTAIAPICSYWSSPGGMDEQIHLFVAQIDGLAHLAYAGLGSEHEDIKVHRFAWREAYQLLKQGKLNNAVTLIGIQWLMLNESQLVAENSLKV